MQQVTAVILTYNEAPNIARVLDRLSWCERIVVVDSGSTDETQAGALKYPAVSWFTRRFDTHAAQWRFAIFETGITTDLVLALDSDMLVPAAFVKELNSNFTPEHTGGVLTFSYCSLGRSLSGSLYPPQLRLLRRSSVSIAQRGHTQEFITPGSVYTFKTHCIHDDRKSLDQWVDSQIKYSALEYQRTASMGSITLKDRLRKVGLMPLAAGVLGYIRAGGPLWGRAALNYAYERMLFEAMLTMRLLRDSSSTTAKRD
jgi:glycosyltransferase involved in cell wall biosynthesis